MRTRTATGTHTHAPGEHGHSHGLVDRSIIRSRAGIKAVSLSLGVLMATALAQAAIFVLSDSVALLADLIHNVGDALTAVPLGIAFFLRSFRGEKIAGLVVVAVIFLSAMVALYEAVDRFIHPKELTHLWALAGAGAIGFLGNEIAAQIRLSRAADSQALHSSLTASMPAWTASCPSGDRERCSRGLRPRACRPCRPGS